MASFTKEEATCTSEILFIGTTQLIPCNETQYPLATATLSIDVISPQAFGEVDFEDIMLFVDILEPTEAEIVQIAETSGFHWGTPQGSGWVEATSSPLPPTRRLRGRYSKNRLYSGVGNGLTYWMGVHLPEGQSLSMRVSATANRVVAITNSCPITMKDFHVNDRLTGMMG
ncbi:hypothetical protein [Streptomyces sp. SID13588]|uniref:hypothetical protein n=1 Tax=Streptomyces sp. SID13588 TaxID=2706051 RepID=UPI0013CC3015|nr:hypothetical protein [Streptomyces sp. SID13588]NEA72147.1 hypothetical protein [Streptomyces sp. SID13588]